MKALSQPMNARDTLIVAIGDRLLSGRKAGAPVINPMKKFARDSPSDDIFAGIGGVIVKSMNVNSGNITEYSIMDWCSQKHYLTHSLCIYGDASLGKTPLGCALLGKVCYDLQARSGQEPYYIKVSSCDGLADAHRDHLMDANIPILFDEVRPGRPQGSRKPMDVENLKKITEVTSSTTLEARFRDIQLNYPQPRIFTFNGQSPGDWHDAIPRELWSMTLEARLRMGSDALAVVKRTAWAHVRENLVPADARKEYEEALRRE